jgi:hypothetical protein
LRSSIISHCSNRSAIRNIHSIEAKRDMDIFLGPAAWRGYRQADFPGDSWAVEDDALCVQPQGPQVDLISCERFGDFDLSFEWRLPAGGNSGLLYRVTEEYEAAWQSGPELQLLDDSVHPDGHVPETSCGALYGLYAPEGRRSCTAGLFNIARVSARGSSVEHWLNGARVLACDLASEDLRRRVSNSKFRQFPQFARAAEGHIVLQHHATAAWFRHIRISPS